ncbi:MAG: type 2 glycerol-3-phosphate oxidase [Mycoplasma sp.]|nr:type 2 glycerol-3-phosphate oxidase [Mycoplasma sp.]
MKMIYDVAIIGGGIIGGSIAYELSQYELKTVVLEKNPLFADETSKGNSGAIHGGFDPEPEKVEARLNVLGNELWRTKIFKDLKFPFVKVDSLIIAFDDEEMEHVHMLYERGIINKVPKEFMRILTKEETLAKEPNLNPELKGSLLCNSSWAIEPVKATIAFMGASKQNGTELRKNSQVTDIKKEGDIFIITINGKETIKTKNIINAAGHYADKVAEMAGVKDFELTARRGEYRILSRNIKYKVNSICFMVPTIHGKGVIVAPMLDGRTMVGPTAEEGISKEATRYITKEKFESIGNIGTKLVPNLELEKTEITLAGSRPIDVETNDFVIRYGKGDKNFINAAGMQSPAIASAPAIAMEIAKLLKENGTELIKDKNYNPKYEVLS